MQIDFDTIFLLLCKSTLTPCFFQIKLLCKSTLASAIAPRELPLLLLPAAVPHDDSLTTPIYLTSSILYMLSKSQIIFHILPFKLSLVLSFVDPDPFDWFETSVFPFGQPVAKNNLLGVYNWLELQMFFQLVL